MEQHIYQHTFANGLTLLGEPMEWLESAAISISLPGGCIQDPDNRLGLASVTSEMVQRGCGPYNSRQFVETLDRLGADRSSAVGHAHASYSAAMLADRLQDTLGVLADLIRRPLLPADQMDDGRQVCLLEIESIEDEPSRLAMIHLRQNTYPGKWGRRAMGTAEGIESIGIEDVREFVRKNYVPDGSTIAVAGKFNWEILRDVIARLFEDWRGEAFAAVPEPSTKGSYRHIEHDSSQTQIAVAFPSIPCADPDFIKARGAVGVLSDGMSSRLFTTVREERGLCYTVYAYHHSLRSTARVMAYAGTGAERAQETLDVLVGELHRLGAGIDARELTRLKARTKSALIMQQESCVSRAGSLSADWYYLGRVQTMEEVRTLVDSLTVPSLNEFLANHPVTQCDIVTLGREPLEVPRAVS